MLFEEPLGLDGEDRPREEVPGGCELIYRGQSATLFSERGHGKSTVATLIGVAAAARGERVYYWDRENGRQLTGRRVASILDAYPDWPDVRERAGGSFVYREYPRLDPTIRPDEMAAAFEGFGLVVYDSLREAIAQLGGNPDTEEAISKFIGLCVTPILRQGGAVLVSDNVGHEATHRPKGSASKLDAIPQAFKVTCAEPFSEIMRGTVEIACTRSRFGDVDRTWTMDVGAGAWELPTVLSPRTPTTGPRGRSQTRRRCSSGRSVQALEGSSSIGAKALIEKAREAGLRKRYAEVLEWLKDLVGEGVLEHSESGYRLPRESMSKDPSERGSEDASRGGSQGGFPGGFPHVIPLGITGQEPR